MPYRPLIGWNATPLPLPHDILDVIARLTRRGVVTKSVTKSTPVPHRKKNKPGKPGCR
jgi:hypothetical protein